jgi:hypothetical protein
MNLSVESPSSRWCRAVVGTELQPQEAQASRPRPGSMRHKNQNYRVVRIGIGVGQGVHDRAGSEGGVASTDARRRAQRREAELQRIDGAISAPADHGRCDQSHHQQQLEEGVNSLSMDIGGSDDSHASFPPGAMATTSRGDNVCGDGNSRIVSELLADRDSYGVPGLLGEVHRLQLRMQLRRRKEFKKTQASLFMKQLFLPSPSILLLDAIDGPHCICIIFSKWCLPVSCQATENSPSSLLAGPRGASGKDSRRRYQASEISLGFPGDFYQWFPDSLEEDSGKRARHVINRRIREGFTVRVFPTAKDYRPTRATKQGG